LLPLASGVVSPFEPEPAPQTNSADPSQPSVGADRWHLAIELPVDFDSLDESEGFAREVVLGERILAVFRHQTRWYAIDGMCSHQGGPLAQGHVADGCVTCPWHGWQYDLATGIQTINRQPLQTVYPVRRNGTRIEVQLPPADDPLDEAS